MRDCIHSEGCIRILKCFLNPIKYMIKQNEPPNPRPGQQVYRMGRDGNLKRIRHTGAEYDPIYDLFVPEISKNIGKPLIIVMVQFSIVMLV